LAYLLNYDTAYGRYRNRVDADGEGLRVDGRTIPLFSEKDPSNLPWKKLNVDLVFECTGVFRHKEELMKHLDAGSRNVILSAPAKSDGVPTVVHGVNEAPDGDRQVVSCASCTTNCIAPVVEVMKRRIGVKKAAMTTIHAYTSTQGIVDGPSKKPRRGRTAACNLVPTTTGAAHAAAKALPQYAGKFDGAAIRTPVPCGSIADMVFLADKETSAEDVNAVLTEEAGTDRYKGILGVTDEPLVSSDILRDTHASIVDLSMTQVIDGDLVKIMSWYDNEWGYACQMVRAALTE